MIPTKRNLNIRENSLAYMPYNITIYALIRKPRIFTIVASIGYPCSYVTGESISYRLCHILLLCLDDGFNKNSNTKCLHTIALENGIIERDILKFGNV